MKKDNLFYKQIPFEILDSFFLYEPRTGLLKRKKDLHLMNPSITANEAYRLNIRWEGKNYKVPALEIVWCLLNKGFCKNLVTAKDLDLSNIKANNLLEVSFEDKEKIRWCLLNLRKYLKPIETKDQHKTVVKFYNKGVSKHYFDDPSTACDFIREYRLKVFKVLEKLGIDVNTPNLYNES